MSRIASLNSQSETEGESGTVQEWKSSGVEQSSTLSIRNLILGELWRRFAQREQAYFWYYSIRDFQVE
jgi:hypothetical protein